MIDFICPICQKPSKKEVGHYNRSMSIGAPVYCGKRCAGIGRRNNKTTEQKKKEKSDYDKKYRYYHRDGIKKRKAEAFKIDYAANPEKYRKERKRRYKAHLEYLNTPEYKAWKKEYDKKYRSQKDFGVFWECALLLAELENYLSQNMPNELKFQMGITNKTQKRKRLWQRQQKNFQQQI